MLAAHEAAVLGMEGGYQQRIMAEVERYAALQAERAALAEAHEEQLTALHAQHAKDLKALSQEYEGRLLEGGGQLQRTREEAAEQEERLLEARAQTEEDADAELQQLRAGLEARLAHEKAEALKHKGEAGLVGKKLLAAHKELADAREEIGALFASKKELYATIASLERDVAGLKRELQERDEAVADKERRIFDLKKKNQELDKFKFVLDYKIGELNKQIEPRELEIASLRLQGGSVNAELEKAHKQFSTLTLQHADLQQRQDALTREVVAQRTRLADAEVKAGRYRAELHEVAQSLHEPKALKEAVKALYAKHCGAHGTSGSAPQQDDLRAEDARQRAHLERNVEALKKCARRAAADAFAPRCDAAPRSPARALCAALRSAGSSPSSWRCRRASTRA